jgi:Fic family protein
LRSSLAKRLGLSDDAPYPTSERSEGLSNIMLDVVSNINSPLTTDRLLTWHQWLFPNIDPIWQKIRVGQWRGDEPMQVVSGRLDRPTIHFEAPPRAILEQEITQFLQWFEQSKTHTQLDPLLRAAIVHFWFVTLHPFDDGNGRLTRALTDLALAQVDQQSIRLYAMSAVILEKRSEYYQILELSQRGAMDITPWLYWFLQTLEATLQQALSNIQRKMLKKLFWQRFYELGLLPEQIKILNRLLEGGETGFEFGISAAQYQKNAKVSKATASRHLADLVAKGCLVKLEGGGRNTRYQIRSITC